MGLNASETASDHRYDDMPDVVCIGESMLTVSRQSGTGLRSGHGCTLHAASAKANVAMYVAVLGHRAAWASLVGADPRWISGSLRGLPIDERIQLGHLVASSALGVVSDVGTLPDAARICRELGLPLEDWTSSSKRIAACR